MMLAMLTRLVSTLAALALAACSKHDRPADANPTPVDRVETTEPAEPAERLEPSPIVDFYVWDGGERICVLHADGRVACAATDGDEFDPPLESLGSAVELTSSQYPVPQVCVRGQQGPVRCLDSEGQVHEVEGISAARSLESRCAVTNTGEFWCWDESFVATLAPLPYFPAGEIQHMALVYDGKPLAGGCALLTAGGLWCWLDAMETLGVDLGKPVREGGHSSGDTYIPVEIANVGDGSQVLDLVLDAGVCWRLAEGWTCARMDTSDPFPPPGRIDNIVIPVERCDTHPCNCSFPEELGTIAFFSCRVPEPDQQFTVDSHHLSGIVRYWAGLRGQCVVDSNDRVWCQTANRALHELVVRR